MASSTAQGFAGPGRLQIGSYSESLRSDVQTAMFMTRGLSLSRARADPGMFVPLLTPKRQEQINLHATRGNGHGKRRLPHAIQPEVPDSRKIDLPLPSSVTGANSDGEKDGLPEPQNGPAAALVREILLQGLMGQEPAMRREMQFAHLVPSVSQAKLQAVISGEEDIDPRNFALYRDSGLSTADTIAHQYNHMLITKLAHYVDKVASRALDRYGLWRRRDWFRYIAGRIYDIISDWMKIQCRPGESREAFIARIAGARMERTLASANNSNRHYKAAGRSALASGYLEAGMMLNDRRICSLARYMLQTLVYLGHEGMSDEEDLPEDDPNYKRVKKVATLPWRAPALTELFEFIDTLPTRERQIFSQSGAPRMARIRTGQPPTALRQVPKNVPLACFNQAWIAEDEFRKVACRIDIESAFELIDLKDFVDQE
ncbi:uncharacterized protein SCHCODRAFT_01170384 [Schizophyllum commune H4-8]|nr:uncharacterized protein SCHCODRAFT_01170384 [Schizophyllum commune H4-8]KAI5896191.1 hypothetical protein SCHCODRAFT_01170384 [Schizophyllum commune H4-8]